MGKFVRVRVVQANAMDLSLFQFDYDLTFAAFFMNADKTIYGRFGSRSSRKDAMKDISIEGLGQALAAALEIHQHYPANRDSLAGKQAVFTEIKVPEMYPSLNRYKPTLDYEGAVVRSCMHCHQIHEAQRKSYRAAGKPMPDKVLYPWPSPETIGLILDPTEKAKVIFVSKDSGAERAGFQSGDEIVSLEGQQILSIADVQWVLHNTPESGTLDAIVRREGNESPLELQLSEGWRRNSHMTWRASAWDLRRMGTGALVLQSLSEDARVQAGLTDAQLGLLVEGMSQYPPHNGAKMAGFQNGDIIVDFDGQTHYMTPSNLLAYSMQNTQPGDNMAVTVLRAGERVDLTLTAQ